MKDLIGYSGTAAGLGYNVMATIENHSNIILAVITTIPIFIFWCKKIKNQNIRNKQAQFEFEQELKKDKL